MGFVWGGPSLAAGKGNFLPQWCLWGTLAAEKFLPKLGQVLFSLTAPCKCQVIPPIWWAQHPAAVQEVLQPARTDWAVSKPLIALQ